MASAAGAISADAGVDSLTDSTCGAATPPTPASGDFNQSSNRVTAGAPFPSRFSSGAGAAAASLAGGLNGRIRSTAVLDGRRPAALGSAGGGVTPVPGVAAAVGNATGGAAALTDKGSSGATGDASSAFAAGAACCPSSARRSARPSRLHGGAMRNQLFRHLLGRHFGLRRNLRRNRNKAGRQSSQDGRPSVAFRASAGEDSGRSGSRARPLVFDGSAWIPAAGCVGAGAGDRNLKPCRGALPASLGISPAEALRGSTASLPLPLQQAAPAHPTRQSSICTDDRVTESTRGAVR